MDRTNTIKPHSVAMAELRLIVDNRLGINKNCGTCFYAYNSMPPTPALVCHWGPPAFQLVQNQAGAAVTYVPRTVANDFFCHQWKSIER